MPTLSFFRRKKRNFITAILQKDKQGVVFQHFMHHIGSYVARTCKLNFSNLGWQPRSLHHLDNNISEEELKIVILSAPKEKAPGPNGFIGVFFSLCWDIIKADLLVAVEYFFSMNQQDLHLLNNAYIVLIPKKRCLKEFLTLGQ
jgi:hypothetical protein